MNKEIYISEMYYFNVGICISCIYVNILKGVIYEKQLKLVLLLNDNTFYSC